MSIELICFTAAGEALSQRLAAALRAQGEQATLARSGQNGVKAGPWAAQHFATAGALVFVGAAGIAVRSIAPLLAGKASDPAVLVADEAGRFVIPLLSGHLGGANALAGRLARLTGGQAVLTTATDVRGVFAVDSWAREQGLVVANPARIQGVSATLLAGGQVGLYSALPLQGPPPAGVVLVKEARQAAVVIAAAPPRREDALWLCPPLTAGIGCRKGSTAEAIGALFTRGLAQAGLPRRAVHRVCSITLKENEPGLRAFCEEEGLPLVCYSAQALAALPGSFTPSAFVAQTTGVNNVCERSAVLGSGGGALVLPKLAAGGVTLALAAARPKLFFGGEG